MDRPIPLGREAIFFGDILGSERLFRKYAHGSSFSKAELETHVNSLLQDSAEASMLN